MRRDCMATWCHVNPSFAKQPRSGGSVVARCVMRGGRAWTNIYLSWTLFDFVQQNELLEIVEDKLIQELDFNSWFHDFVQTGFSGSMVNNAKCSWYFSHLILAPCPGLVKRLTKLISQPATLKLKENIKKNHIGAKVSSSFLSQGFNNFIHLHSWPRFKSHPESSALKTTGFNNQGHEVTWSSE